MLLAGCHRGPKIPQSDYIPPSTQEITETPIVVPIESHPAKSGPLPLVYLMEHPGEIKIVDATTGATVLQTRAGGRTIISLSADRGIVIGSKPMPGARLDPMHEYEIYLLTSSPNVGQSIYERR